MSRLYPLAACPEFLEALPALSFTRRRIPQLRDVSEALTEATGWQVRPVAGLMHPRDFLAGLAFRTFHSTQYLWHASRPSYTPVSFFFFSFFFFFRFSCFFFPLLFGRFAVVEALLWLSRRSFFFLTAGFLGGILEKEKKLKHKKTNQEPDVCHELLGHVPMLANKSFTEMVRAIGVASLGADEARLWHLTKLYWFGVVVVGGGGGRNSSSSSSSSSSVAAPPPKAFGAGIISSFGEMEHLLSGEGYSVAPFDPFAPQPKMSYKDGVQKRYFSLESFEAGRELLLEYCAATTPLDVRSRFGLLEGAASGQAAAVAAKNKGSEN